ncbi:MAG: succinate dehydrogenase/fumarate reductase iron-sulfur subunit [Candidatus Aminicenantaceae bacterium]
MEYTFKILRYDPLNDEHPRFQEYPYSTEEAKSILEALMDIRNEQDCTLSFRYSCREAICGSCAMVINGSFDLACRTMVESLKSILITIEPLPNLEIQKDLVVDMEPFWDALQKIEPFINPREEMLEKGSRIEEKEMEKIEQFISCIMCGSCYSACPVVTRDNRYLGPSALAKLYRLVKDPRDMRPFSRWSRVNTEGGAWGCDTIFKCNEVCPKDVRPADGIEALRRKLIAGKIKRLFRLKK